MSKIIALDLPYPTASDLEKDLDSARIIAPAYAGARGELNAVLQYIYHFYQFNALSDDTANTLIGISLAEMRHLRILGEVMEKLGADPVYTAMPPYMQNFYSAAFVSYSKTPKKMLLDDIAGELVAINDYEKMLARLKNEKVAAIISRIVLDEELHVKVLKEKLAPLCRD